MPKLVATINQKLYDALTTKVTEYNNQQLALDSNFTPISVDQWSESFLIVPFARNLANHQEKEKISEKLDKYFRADPVIQAQVDDLLADPVIPDSVVADPVIPDPVVLDPVISDPVVKDPVIQDPIIQDPVVPVDPVLP